MEERKILPNGEVVIKSGEGVYFHAMDNDSLPIVIDKDEGEKLFNQ